MKSTSMKGGGFYDANSAIQALTSNVTIPLIAGAVPAIKMPENGEPFLIADYGCSEGKNSIAQVRQAVTSVRAIEPRKAICVVYNDLFSNDFNRLYRNIEESETASKSPNVFTFSSGTSFYQPVLPPHSVHLGISSWSAHWLSQMPKVTIKNHIYFAKAEGEARSRLAGQAASDWERFLLLRASELCPFGKFVFALPSSLGDQFEKAKKGDGGPQDMMNSVMQEMLGEGHIDRKRYEDFIWPYYFRTLEEALEPFQRSDSKVSQLLSADFAEVQKFDCPIHARFLATSDRRAYAEAYVGWLRAWTEPLLKQGLFDEEKPWLLDDFYRRLCDKKFANPEEHVLRIETLFLVLTRKS